jgi:GAF domain-containing protein
MINTIDEIQAGRHDRRAIIITSDETAELTLRLNQLLDQLAEARQELEHTVEERTADLTHKTTQLQAAAQVAREAAALQDVNVLLARTVDLISDRFNFYHTGIFLLDDPREYAVLQAASSEGGKRMLARGHRLEVGRQGIVGATASQNRSHISMDVSADKSYFKNPDLPMTRSEAAIPLTGRGQVIGVLDIQSTEPAAFSQSDIDIFQTLADQIGLAIQNARSVAESQEALKRLEAASAENMRRVWRERTRGSKRAYRYTASGLTALNTAEKPAASASADAKLLNIPINLRGQRIGVIGLHRSGDTSWSDSDRSLALEIADQVGLALENARLLDEAQRRATQEQALSQLTASLSRSLDPETLLQTAVRELHQLPNVSEVSVYVTPPPSPSAEEPPKPKEQRKHD